MDTATDEAGTSKEDKEKENAEKKKAKEPEPDHELLSNPARVLDSQLPLISIPKDCRYKPVVSSGAL